MKITPLNGSPVVFKGHSPVGGMFMHAQPETKPCQPIKPQEVNKGMIPTNTGKPGPLTLNYFA